MEKLVVTPEAYAPFFLASGGLELCDPSGQTLEYFVRSDDRIIDDPQVYEWVKAHTTEEELASRRREPGGRTTAEVLVRLEAL